LLFAAGLSFFLGETTDTGIILVIVFLSGIVLVKAPPNVVMASSATPGI
jgi:hypothetical protein